MCQDASRLSSLQTRVTSPIVNMSNEKDAAVEEQQHAYPKDVQPPIELPSLEATNKTNFQRRTAIFACGAGLFSDGYLNGVRTRFFCPR